jgi:hypothetical protein
VENGLGVMLPILDVVFFAGGEPLILRGGRSSEAGLFGSKMAFPQTSISLASMN